MARDVENPTYGVNLSTGQADNLNTYEEEMFVRLFCIPPVDHKDYPIDDLLDIYLREVGNLKLLSQKEEALLSKKVKRAKRAENTLNMPLLEDEVVKELEDIISEGDGARNLLVLYNLPWVISIAETYRDKGLHFLDLIQAGNLGLIKASDGFDHEKGRFTTYATLLIRQAIEKEIANFGRTIRIPKNMGWSIGNMFGVSRELEQKLGRQPTYIELAKALGLSEEKVIWMMFTSQLPIELNKPVGDEDDGREVGHFTEDSKSSQPSSGLDKEELEKEIERLFKNYLTDEEAIVIRLLFGFDDGEPRSNKNVGEIMNLTPKRVVGLKREVLRKLRLRTSLSKSTI